MTLSEFNDAGHKLSMEAGVLDSLHGYFALHSSRLFISCRQFSLFDGPLGNTLEIGPFFSYVPFIIRGNASNYTVVEGDDPAVYPLQPLYKRAGIKTNFVDLFDIFGPVRDAPRKLPFPDGAFDTILCWETMEHFNFNPVSFLHEMSRLLSPKGRICITVPNSASAQNIVRLITGWHDAQMVQAYLKFADYVSNGKTAFYGFHWHEYTADELAELFAGCGFRADAGYFMAHLNNGKPSMLKKVLRVLNIAFCRAFPRYATNVQLVAVRA